jgi:hypothetical protein
MTDVARVSGSHHIFTKPRCRCIPVAFHDGTITPSYAATVLRQAGLDPSRQVPIIDDDGPTIESTNFVSESHRSEPCRKESKI